MLFQASQSAEPSVREVAFRIISSSPSVIEKQPQDLVQGVFTKGFRDDTVSVWLGDRILVCLLTPK